jgi:hypothetical protein
VPDHPFDPASDFETDFRQLRGLARTGLAANDNDLIVPNEISNLPPPLHDGEIVVVVKIERFEKLLAAFHWHHYTQNGVGTS